VNEILFHQQKTWILREVSDVAPSERVAAWEMIAEGRYMPRRVRGSLPGRELG
jgi:hypothetical protein